eukprot:UN08021
MPSRFWTFSKTALLWEEVCFHFYFANDSLHYRKLYNTSF